jgi:hypothetical protein
MINPNVMDMPSHIGTNLQDLCQSIKRCTKTQELFIGSEELSSFVYPDVIKAVWHTTSHLRSFEIPGSIRYRGPVIALAYSPEYIRQYQTPLQVYRFRSARIICALLQGAKTL